MIITAAIGGVLILIMLIANTYWAYEQSTASTNQAVSIGYTTLQPNDEQVHDLFERADHMMYDRKKELKNMGAKTRES